MFRCATQPEKAYLKRSEWVLPAAKCITALGSYGMLGHASANSQFLATDRFRFR
jgi:hypothetical protein